MALLYKGAKLKGLEASIANCDDLLRRYECIEQPVFQANCAQVQVYKGALLSCLENFTAAVDCYGKLLANYAKSENPAIKQACQFARIALAGFTFINNQSEAVLEHIHRLREQDVKINQVFAIMSFLRWIADSDSPQKNILNVIRQLPVNVKFDWDWNEVYSQIDQLSEPRKAQANHYIAFFEEHQDVERLERELASVIA